MLCHVCGTEVGEDIKFCPKCGSQVISDSSAESQNCIVINEEAEKENAKKKKTAVTLSVIACVLTVFGAILGFLAQYFSQIATMDPAPDFFVRYLGANIANILTDVFVPAIIAVLFTVFCCLVIFSSNTRKALTGIPMILTVADSIVAFAVSLFIISKNAAAYNDFSIFLMNIWYFITSTLGIVLTTLFVIFYMLNATNKFARPSTGRILVIIFGIAKEFIALLTLFSGIISDAARPQNIYGVYKIVSLFARLFNFSAGLITVIAMIILAFRFASSVNYASYANGQDAPSFGYAVLGFFIPLVGLIIYLSAKDSTPMKAKSAGKGALVGFITNIVLSILLSGIYVLIIFALL
ncbi:MAG: zinc ribbon domain-containing protein [Clostridia bacterium]|nr:zinc ribbon domain-containing protein [Clostridia bacterium]